jgi:site-specific recombinase XerD
MTRITAASLAKATPETSPTLLDTLPRFRRHLAAENKSLRTIKSYAESVERLHEFLVAAGMPVRVEAIHREHVDAFVADQLERLKPASARIRYASVRQFFKWLVGDGEISASPMENMKPPKVPQQPVPVLTDDELRVLFRTVDKAPRDDFLGRRDRAILRLFYSTGARLSELCAIQLGDLDLKDPPTVTILGRGGRYRVVAMGRSASEAIDRYLAVRERHPDKGASALWLGTQGPMTSTGIAEVVKRRGIQAGIGPIHPHQLRHTAAHKARLRGMDDDAVMMNMGWTDRSMLHRYGKSAAAERAREAALRIGWGDDV